MCTPNFKMCNTDSWMSPTHCKSAHLHWRSCAREKQMYVEICGSANSQSSDLQLDLWIHSDSTNNPVMFCGICKGTQQTHRLGNMSHPPSKMQQLPHRIRPKPSWEAGGGQPADRKRNNVKQYSCYKCILKQALQPTAGWLISSAGVQRRGGWGQYVEPG